MINTSKNPEVRQTHGNKEPKSQQHKPPGNSQLLNLISQSESQSVEVQNPPSADARNPQSYQSQRKQTTGTPKPPAKKTPKPKHPAKIQPQKITKRIQKNKKLSQK